jgi:SAM-dependent methyltransferase
MLDNDKIKWEKKYADEKFFLKWPDEIVVRFMAKHMKKKPQSKVLDLGCGSGRHSELLSQEGYDVYGCDISTNSITISSQRLKLKNLKGKFQSCYSWSLPYESDFFDFVIAWGSIYYNTFPHMVETIEEIHRVLKEDGKALIGFIADGDYREINGKTSDGKTYVGNESAHDHYGLTYSIINREEIEQLFHDKFSDFSTGYQEMYFDLNPRICHWIITARK